MHPGDTIWLRAGTYTGAFTSNLNGTATAPIVLRQYSGERATINGYLVVRGSYTVLWGFEVMNSAPTTGGRVGIQFASSTESRLVNLVIHDASASGIGFWNESVGGEAYGCIIYNNGTEYNLDHGIYITNVAGTKLAADNVVFNNWTYGLHAYSPTAGTLTNIHLDGNVVFGNGTTSSPPNSAAGIIVAGTPAQGIRVTNNYSYSPVSRSDWSARIGVYAATNDDVVVTGNTFVKFVQIGPWNSATVSENTFYSDANVLSITGPLGGITWSNNVHYRDPAAAAWGAADLSNFQSWQTWRSTTGLGTRDSVAGKAPAGTRVIVRKNRYEAGRAHIIIYNWDRLPMVGVDVSAILRVGDPYEVRNVQDFYGSPVLSGVYDGGVLTLPTRGITPVAPIGRSFTPAPVTGPEFNVFVVLPRGR